MYKQLLNIEGNLSSMILRLEDRAFIPMNPDNTDYQVYLAWLELGNTPEPADLP